MRSRPHKKKKRKARKVDFSADRTVNFTDLAGGPLTEEAFRKAFAPYRKK